MPKQLQPTAVEKLSKSTSNNFQEKEINYSPHLFLVSTDRASTYDGTNRGASHTKLAPVTFGFYPIVQQVESPVPERA